MDTRMNKWTLKWTAGKSRWTGGADARVHIKIDALKYIKLLNIFIFTADIDNSTKGPPQSDIQAEESKVNFHRDDPQIGLCLECLM